MKLLLWELRKLAGDPAARAGLVIVCAVLLVALLGFAAQPGGAAGSTVSSVQAAGHAPVPEVYMKGLAFACCMLGPLAGILVPAVLCFVLGGTVAGEAEAGTLAEALSRPVARWRLIAAKLAGGIVYASLLMGVAAAVALVAAPLVLGPGKVLTSLAFRMTTDPASGAMIPRPDIESLEGGRAILKLVPAYAVATFGLFAVVALAVLASAAAERARTAAAVAAGVYFGIYALSKAELMLTPPVAALGSFRRYLLVGHMEAWRALLRPEIEWGRLFSGGVVVLAAFAFLAVAGVLVFNGRELAPRE